MKEQFFRISSAIEYTLDQLRRGPKARHEGEPLTVYQRRAEQYFDHKHRFCLFAIKCLKQMDKNKAEVYLADLRQLGDDI